LIIASPTIFFILNFRIQ